ncbi:MAG: hypothetical protein IIC82_05285 [Chloroflexi bacterium]|nr:hypothetical protein [Chloroflexota bacterium]
MGGGLGAAAGSLAFDSIEDLLRFAGVLEPTERSPFDPAIRALKAGGEDVMFAGGFAAAGGLVRTLKPIVGKVLGMRNDNASAVIEQAKQAGLVDEAGDVAVGAIDIARGIRGTILRGTGKVLGIFPWIGGPFRKAARQKADVVISATNRILNTLAPNAVLADELGINMVRAARGAVEEFRATAGQLYNNFRQLSSKITKPIIPTNATFDILDDGVETSVDGIKGLAQRFAERAKAGKIVLEDGEELAGPAAEAFDAFIGQLTKLPDRLTVAQLEGLSGQLQDFISKAAADGFDVRRFMDFKKAMEVASSADNLIVDGLEKGVAEGVIAAKRAADSFYAKGIGVFQTATAKKFGRVDKNLFRFGPIRPGTIDEDLIADAAINLKSPQALRDLRSLVGDDLMNKAARRHLERAWDNSIIIEDDIVRGMDWDKLKKEFGFAGREPERAAALATFLDGSGVSVDELRSLVEVASKIQIPANVAQFVARRAALGGLGSAAAGASASTIVQGSMLKSVGVAWLLRRFNNVISSPAQLRMMRRAIAPGLDVTQRRLLIGRLMGAAIQQEPEPDVVGF